MKKFLNLILLIDMKFVFNSNKKNLEKFNLFLKKSSKMMGWLITQ